MTWRIGADIGGTFIDFCALDTRTNRLETLKVLTTPEEPGRELANGLQLLRERHGIESESIGSFVHGTTVGINTIIQRKGCRLALITTAGFEDVIELARLRMPEMYSLFCARPEQLISRDLVFGVAERVLADGSVIETLNEDMLVEAINTAALKNVDGVIVSFLHAYRNPVHEQRAKALIEKHAAGLFVFTSSEVWPVIREYERTTTAILNGYVHPRVARYCDSLEQALVEHHVPAQAMLTKSNGGVMNIAAGKKACVSMLLSGTASGVMGASFVAEQAGVKNILTLDVGGTSADLALIIDGQPQFGTGELIGDFPLYVPSVSVTSIGSGGGSIAWTDQFGVLKVGPESAGSTPGPACYDRGGERPTITDAMAVCGFLGHTPLAYSQIKIDIERAQKAFAPIAEKLNRSVPAAAEAVIQVAVSEMFLEVNKLVARFGVDPRDFTLMPFGGAGPMLGCFLARELGIAQVLVPRHPGVVSALGGLIADLKSDFIQTVFLPVDQASIPSFQQAVSRLEEQGRQWLEDEQRFSGIVDTVLLADMRYHGQSFEIEVVLEHEWVEKGDVASILDAFHRQHLALYDFNDEAAEVQIVNLRLVVSGKTARPDLVEDPLSDSTASPIRQIEVWFDGAMQSVPLYDRSKLHNGHSFVGPAVVVQEDTTVCIPAGFEAKVDSMLNILLTLKVQVANGR